MMMVRVKLFAAARELVRANEVLLEVGDGSSVGDVRDALVAAVPAIDAVLPHARWAVDAEFVSIDTVIGEHSEVALIPPVSGG